jgi:methylmalonyl-CoA/ethylmalonyl-CoA epimerase
VARFIEKYGEGVHHLAFEVKDIHKEISRLTDGGYILINEQPEKGADNKWVVFLHPRSTNKVLIELCQEIRESDDH